MNLLVLGGAVSGRAAARLGRRLGHSVAIYDGDEGALSAAAADGYDVRGPDWDPAAVDDADLVVTSPGIPEGAPPVRDGLASGRPLWSEMEFAARHLGVPYAAVTGTNGKTTVTSAATDMLRACGIDAVAAGNIGMALSDVVGTTCDAVVVEASSFQLRFAERFHPAAAAILNIAPDHLDWHGDMDAYRAAKMRIFENQSESDLLVYDEDDEGARTAIETAPSRVAAVSGSHRPPAGSGPDGHQLWIGDETYDLPGWDGPYLVDLVAAGLLAGHLGATRDGVAAVLEDFTPGRHRRETVGTWRGVTWINDSKATNPHAASAAARSYPSVVLIAGGRNKGLDLEPVAAAPSVRLVVGLGEAKGELRAAAGPDRFVPAASLEEAVALADRSAAPGDVVLLAPGCASFDMFESYGERGEAFAAAVLEHQEDSSDG
ncbi:MAG: UDP-N-acetylmuramoyl-L-alanine--D-glutamate ligase [Acidimicrobiia bacterium]